jgi:hypothetical protein
MTDTFNPLVEMEAAASLADLIEQNAAYAKPPTGKDVELAHQQAITKKDMDKLLAIQAKMAAAIDKATANVFVTPDDLDLEETLLAIYDELMDNKDIAAFGKARYDMIRTMIFNKITADNMAMGIADPDMAPGVLEVPGRGAKLSRVGGKKLVDLDPELLAKKLGKKRWAKVSKTITHPPVEAYTETVLDHEALQELVNEDPKVLELFRESLEITGYTPQRLVPGRLEE